MGNPLIPNRINAVPHGYPQFQSVRPSLRLGPFVLSIQASKSHYCSPRQDGYLLSQYSKVEIALITQHGGFIKPSALNILGLDHLWSGDTVAGFVEWNDVNKIIRAVKKIIPNRISIKET